MQFFFWCLNFGIDNYKIFDGRFKQEEVGLIMAENGYFEVAMKFLYFVKY